MACSMLVVLENQLKLWKVTMAAMAIVNPGKKGDMGRRAVHLCLVDASLERSPISMALLNPDESRNQVDKTALVKLVA